VLLGLAAELFDSVPIDRMTDAEHAVQAAAANIPAQLRARLDAADKLNEEDRATIVGIARDALLRFQAAPEQGGKS
jgi:F-type H+/Na+-transporting ATPase subunit alpha